MTAIDVYVEINGLDVRAGRLYGHQRRGTESATFAYDSEYLAHPAAYSLDPTLPLMAGSHQTSAGTKLFNAFSDTAPDRWGRNLIDRHERLRAAATGSPARRITDIDYLLGVRDDLRQGALRFRDIETGAFVASDDVGVPAIADLPELVALAGRVETEDVVADELLRLVRAGSSLGGARPKTHVRASDGRAAIAKFPSTSVDTWNVMAWEKVALNLARASGISVPASTLIDIAGRSVLVIRRFDRTAANARVGYVSALTLLEASDGERRSYLEIGEVIEEHSPHATEDLNQLWRRMTFSVLISNTDDHLRNHAFLHRGWDSWALSPAFDLNPDPSVGPKELSTAITDHDASAQIDLLIEVAGFFRLDLGAAVETVREIAMVVGEWKACAQTLGLSRIEIARMEPAFVHEASSQAGSL